MSSSKDGAALTPDQAHAILGGSKVISRATFYSAIKKGQIPHRRVGARRIIIPRQAFLKWLETGVLQQEDATLQHPRIKTQRS